MELKTLEDLLIHCLADLRDAEKQLIRALPKMAEATTDPILRKGFEDHLEQTREQEARLREIQDSFKDVTEQVTCKGMEGLIKEGEEILKMQGDPDVKDAALMGAAQKVEHYEMAGYISAIDLATKLGMKDVAKILQKSLEEESYTAEKLRMMEEASEAQ